TDFDPGSGTFNLTSTAASTDFYILKLDPEGKFVWATSTGNANPEISEAIDVDMEGNVVSSGRFVGTVDFDPGPGTANLAPTGAGIYVQKLDANGNYLWARHIAFPTVNNRIMDLKVDGTGNVYFTGYFSDTTDLDP